MAVLLGHRNPPAALGNSVESLMEYANAVFARAGEIAMAIQRGEREGFIAKGSAHYKFRTGELRTFMDIAKASGDMGSRRITLAKMEYEMEHRDDNGNGH